MRFALFLLLSISTNAIGDDGGLAMADLILVSKTLTDLK
jgi:hypothetical protein